MSEKVGFLMDGQEVLTYDRSVALPHKQQVYLDDMDKKMAAGFELSGDIITNPDQQQKAQFVALNLVNALQQEDDQMAIILFTYLVNRLSDLKQVKAKIQDMGSGQKIGVEFIFDEVKPQGQKIEFHPAAKMH